MDDERTAQKEAAGARLDGLIRLDSDINDVMSPELHVLRRWIDGRKGLPANLALMREFRDVAARIAELIHWFDSADLVLTDTLAHTLTREELGFSAPPQEDAQPSDD